MSDDYSITFGNAPKDRHRSNNGLQGKQAYALGKAWGTMARSKYSSEEVAGLVRTLAQPKNDHDRGVLEGLTNGEG